MILEDVIVYNNSLKTNKEFIYSNMKNVNINAKKLKAALNYYDDLIDQASEDINSDLYILLCCILKVINDCNFTTKQDERLSMWMKGYTEKEIAKYYDVSEVTIHNSLAVVCNKVAKKLKGELNRVFR